ncbi:MAG: rhodanese-related sulfurtransferase [Hyphomicrobiaceae bacterium]
MSSASRTVITYYEQAGRGVSPLPDPKPNSIAACGSRSVLVAALYRFAAIADPGVVLGRLQAAADTLGIRGTLILAQEGINGTVAGRPVAVAALLALIRAMPGFAGLSVKFSWAAEMPFGRLKARLKPEIVTMGVEGIDPAIAAGIYVAPGDWNDLIRAPGTLVIDTRNAYEVAIGTFAGAADPSTHSFREFPAWIEARLRTGPKPERIAMFCTGGIRCEKATAYVRSLGFDDVYHLDGGILRYLAEVAEAESLWRGACFVFDERVAVGHGLEQQPFSLCRSCGRPFPLEPGATEAGAAGGGYRQTPCEHCAQVQMSR